MKPISSGTGPHDAPARARARQLLDDRWALRILASIDEASGARFSDLALIPGLSRRVLADRLRVLVDRGVVRTEQYQRRPVRHRYVPTERGRQLQVLLDAVVHVAAGGRLDHDPLARARDAATGEPTPGSPPEPVAAYHPAEALLGADLDAAARIHDATIAALVRYDDQYRTSLLQTLVTWFACDTSISVAASQLYTHRHTIRYRLDRIRELTGFDAATSDGREQLMLGLRARRVLVEAGRIDAD